MAPAMPEFPLLGAPVQNTARAELESRTRWAGHLLARWRHKHSPLVMGKPADSRRLLQISALNAAAGTKDPNQGRSSQRKWVEGNRFGTRNTHHGLRRRGSGQCVAFATGATSFGAKHMHRFLIASAALALTAFPAAAHPKLVASTPADGATIAAPAEIKLAFSEKLFANLSGAKLMRGEGQAAAKVEVSFRVDGKSMVIAPAAPLSAGSYTLEWHGVAGDTHRVTGAVRFIVR